MEARSLSLQCLSLWRLIPACPAREEALGSLSLLVFGTCWSGGKNTDHLGLCWRRFGQVTPDTWAQWLSEGDSTGRAEVLSTDETLNQRVYFGAWFAASSSIISILREGISPSPSKAQGLGSQAHLLFWLGSAAGQGWMAGCGAEWTAPFPLALDGQQVCVC